MSIIGDIFGPGNPDDRYVDDQTLQEDHRDDTFVGPAIETACAVYDTMFDALKFVIRGKADVLGKMDKAVAAVEKRCNALADRYREMLQRLNDAGADFTAGLNLDIIKDAFDLLDSNPVLRRYVGEANYWLLWDTLALMSSQGAEIDSGISSNLKGAIKSVIYAFLSMTNGMMHFESYLSQITTFWGWLYAKEIWLPLTDSICPQVTCAYYYKPADNGQLEGSAPVGAGTSLNALDRYNPVPGKAAFAPMPIPVFDYENNSILKIKEHFSYDNPDTWDVLTPGSRAAFIKAYKYWRSNYTNATGVNGLLSAASGKLTGGAFTAGFGRRKHNHPLGTPLQAGRTFAQLYSGKNESFPVAVLDDPILELCAAADEALAALVGRMASTEVASDRDARLVEALGAGSEHVGSWAYIGHGTGVNPDESAAAAWGICRSVLSELQEFSDFLNAITELSLTYFSKYGTPYYGGAVGDWGRPYNDPNVWQSPVLQHVVSKLTGLNSGTPIAALAQLMESYNSSHPEWGLPYAFYTADATGRSDEIYEYVAEYASRQGAAPLYSAAAAILSTEMDVDNEIGRKVDGGRKPLFAAIGVYGDLKGLFSWDYKVVAYDGFIAKYAKIKGPYHLYYNKEMPGDIVFADHVIPVGPAKYIAMCHPAATETVTRGPESYALNIFPGESCAVHIIPESVSAFGADFPSLASLQRVDAAGPDGVKYRFDVMTNAIPRWPKYVDPEKWSVMDLLHELWLLADALAPICGDGGRRKDELAELLNGFGLVADGPNGGPRFIGQLPEDDGSHARIEFTAMNGFARRLRDAIDAVYGLREDVIAATQAW